MRYASAQPRERKEHIVSEKKNTRKQLKEEVIASLRRDRGVSPDEATAQDVYWAVSTVVRNHMADTWIHTQEDTRDAKVKTVGYLCAEWLLGNQLPTAELNSGLMQRMDGVIRDLGFTPEQIVDQEHEPGLGNGGLGRLAACYIDSLATEGIPAFGYGIRYTYGIFTQKFGKDGSQIETPDYWLKDGNPWERVNHRREQLVSFGGTTYTNPDGTHGWNPAWQVRAVPYDYLVPGYKSGRVNTLRLWSAKAVDEFDLKTFNKSDYRGAVVAQVGAENISKVLYPEDSTWAGKQLRLMQQYFFSAASLADAVDFFYPGQTHPDLRTLPDKICFQLNDTHPTVAIAELMRLLLDKYGYDWDTAWDITKRTFNYTCHTLLPEALEVWDATLFGQLLPRHLEIIQRISDLAAEDEAQRGADEAKVERMRITPAGKVRMAYLATIGGTKVNGVAPLHSQLLKESVLKDFADVYPEKFTNVTNGVTPRRFMRLANPGLSKLITDALGSDRWITDSSRLSGLAKLTKDDTFMSAYRDVRRANKVSFANYLKRTVGVDVDPDSMFDTMIKRLHEYKRQSMRLLAILAMYNGLKSGKIDLDSFVPRTMIFGAKAAPGYQMAKQTIRLINCVARVINNDPDIDGKLKVVFIPNYNVTVAEHIIPATDLDEQISLAGEEASGTSNMKFAMNGALTLGTYDGANIEIYKRVGAENFYLFGMKVDAVEKLAKSYNPESYYENDADIKAAIDLIDSGAFSNGDTQSFSMFTNDLKHKDRFMALADFRSYMDIQPTIERDYLKTREWDRRSLLNVANSGYFSSDRSIEDYATEIWRTQPLPAVTD